MPPTEYSEVVKAAMTYTAFSAIELMTMLTADPMNGNIIEELVRRYRPVILGESAKYRRTLIFDTDDYLQEARILLWKTAKNRNFNPASIPNPTDTQAAETGFTAYFIAAIRRHLCKLYRKYVLKNMVRVKGWYDNEECDCLVIPAKAEHYREQDRIRSHRSYERRKAKTPPKPKKNALTEEERREQISARRKAYYNAHIEECRRRSREFARKKRAEEKAAREAERQRLGIDPAKIAEERHERRKAKMRAYYQSHKEDYRRRAQEYRSAQRSTGSLAEL